ncbi:nuclear transport factor 2 family protein [Sulfurimonas sp. HSL3-2]|uniref:nuclear transport factor 2 family protein n=1 Tax=Hydrocurvibacter mobilis TaxID=3131936 RepID=UPI0031F8CA59
MNEELRKPLPPFDMEGAVQKVKMAENAWNLKDAQKISMAYSLDSQWRNRDLFLIGRDEIVSFLKVKFAKEIDYKLCKELWAFTDNKIAVRFAYEWRDKKGQWYRSYGNENWEFDEKGYMQRRIASINDLPINEKERKFLWDTEIRPGDYQSLSEMGL